jgi:hypothetical protein
MIHQHSYPKASIREKEGPVFRNFVLAIAVVFLPSALAAQQALNNESVIKLAKAGLSDDVIVSTINASAGNYNISPDSLIAFKSAGVSDKVISAVVAHAPAPPPDVAEPSTLQEGTSSGSGKISPGARVVIAPMGGFETYFAAAVREKRVPIQLTLERQSAEYFIVSTNTEWQGFVYGSGGGATWSHAGGSAAYGASASSTRGLEASIMLISARTKDVIWAYEVHKSSHGALLFGTFGARGQQSIAEACAKHLKEYIEKGK